MASNLPDLDSLIDEKISYLIKYHFDRPNIKINDRSSFKTNNENPNNEIKILEDDQSSLLLPNTKSNLNAEDSDTFKWGQIIIYFLDKSTAKIKKKTGWFGQGKSDNEGDLSPWESWTINIKCLPLDSDRNTSSTKDISNVSSMVGLNESKDNLELSTESFDENMQYIVYISDTHKDHIPPITSLESSPFPYSIEIKPDSSTTKDDASWGQYIKKILD